MSKEFRTVTVPIEAVPDPESAKKHRARQTLNNLLLALAASVGIVLVIVLATPRNDTNQIASIDYRSVAAQVQQSTPNKLILPILQDGWKCTAARWNGSPADGVQTWYAGFVSPTGAFVSLTQAFAVNPTWLTLQTAGDLPTSEFKVGGETWQEFKSPAQNNPPKTSDYILMFKNGNDAVLLSGTAPSVVFNDFANQVVNQLKVVK